MYLLRACELRQDGGSYSGDGAVRFFQFHRRSRCFCSHLPALLIVLRAADGPEIENHSYNTDVSEAAFI